jgi:hypothetical protein
MYLILFYYFKFCLFVNIYRIRESFQKSYDSKLSVSSIACFLTSLMRLIPNLTKIWCRDFFICGSLEFCYKSTTCLKYTFLLLPYFVCVVIKSFGLLTFDSTSSPINLCCYPAETREKACDLTS